MRFRICAFVLLLSACRPSDPKNPNTWLKRLSDSDPRTRQQAVQELRKLKAREEAGLAQGQIGDASAIPALQHALVLERQGVSLLPEASYSLFQLGSAAVMPLIRMAKDEDPAYLKWARENNRAPAGTYAKAALVLGDLGDARAMPVLLEKLHYKDPDPLPGTARLLTNLVRQLAANALGRLRAREAAAPILALVQTRDPQQLDLVRFCSEALVWIGDRGQAKELARRAGVGNVRLRLTVAQAASLFGGDAVL